MNSSGVATYDYSDTVSVTVKDYIFYDDFTSSTDRWIDYNGTHTRDTTNHVMVCNFCTYFMPLLLFLFRLYMNYNYLLQYL
jgi:hypothetical protein